MTNVTEQSPTRFRRARLATGVVRAVFTRPWTETTEVVLDENGHVKLRAVATVKNGRSPARA
jgi:hypothetical protein